MSSKYFVPNGGLPGQKQLLTDRAIFTEAYAVIPKGTMRDIVTSFLPFWNGTRLWVIARPLSGFAETFSQYIMEVQPGGGSERTELDSEAQGVLFVVEGTATLSVNGQTHTLTPGGYAYLPPSSGWKLHNKNDEVLRFHWVRKAYEAVEGIDSPDVLILNENDIAPIPMPDTNGKWATTRFVDPDDLRHGMHANIVTFEPGGVILFLKRMSWNTGFTFWRAKRFTISTTIGLRWKQGISCGCALFARRPAMRGPEGSAIFFTGCQPAHGIAPKIHPLNYERA